MADTLNIAMAPRHSPSLQATAHVPVELSADVELVGRCRAGDAASWRELYAENFDFAWRIARRLGTPQSELEDVAQESFEIAFTHLADFREGRFRTWLYRIVANVVSSRHRGRRVRELFMGLLGNGPARTDSSLQPRVEARETLVLVQQVLARMAPKKREVFALHELEGLPHAEIAELVGTSVETVRTRLFHARKEFDRACLKRGVEP
jgi:RNA polymerase sigma-70 factor (ECF subfamily)